MSRSGRNKVTGAVALDPEHVERLKERAKQEDVSVSWLVDQYVHVGLSLDSKPMTPEERKEKENLAVMNMLLEDFGLTELSEDQWEFITNR